MVGISMTGCTGIFENGPEATNSQTEFIEWNKTMKAR
jgi:hypothetical protein